MFSCECGFAYARSGPDTSPEDRFRAGRTITFGPVWEAKLKELWEETSQGLSEVGRKLGVDPLTIRRHASLMGLSFSRSGKQFKPLKRTTRLKGKTVSAAWEKKRYQFRSKWLSARKQKPEDALKALRGKLPREYAWLIPNGLNVTNLALSYATYQQPVSIGKDVTLSTPLL
jgi:hypothetical protein